MPCEAPSTSSKRAKEDRPAAGEAAANSTRLAKALTKCGSMTRGHLLARLARTAKVDGLFDIGRDDLSRRSIPKGHSKRDDRLSLRPSARSEGGLWCCVSYEPIPADQFRQPRSLTYAQMGKLRGGPGRGRRGRELNPTTRLAAFLGRPRRSKMLTTTNTSLMGCEKRDSPSNAPRPYSGRVFAPTAASCEYG
jgi:hypothetical protein